MLDQIEHSEVKTLVNLIEQLYYEVDELEYPKILIKMITSGNYPLNIQSLVGSALFNYDINKLSNEKTVKITLPSQSQF